jgi:hypothetical protein
MANIADFQQNICLEILTLKNVSHDGNRLSNTQCRSPVVSLHALQVLHHTVYGEINNFEFRQ